ncbi:class I SAM-dependent methyltransferase [Streptomyces sp. BPTC-684]|uniref:class I SAM-dependent methyltransferase n=1 Tax=Streptomyces sp. BPTC-684 TaxID=3043734 RepID=UPI0024B27B68|nr:class I SAM-dependent methyltransferase [Streptomyces sp. BPTC-684]WHM37884.1 methyltransferase domain-containing protein [Streptomyces sp. BPTC-684]
MNRPPATRPFAPLDAQQTLHLFDALTWFPAPTDEAARWRRAAEHIAAHTPGAQHPSPEVCRAVAERVLAASSLDPDPVPASGGGPAELYRAKYHVMTVLYPDSWFTFMNMGYDDGLPTPPALPIPPSPVWESAARLYHLTAGQALLADTDVLDVGAGRGGGTALVARAYRPRSIVGLDSTPANVEFARRTHREPGLSFRRGEAEFLPYPDAHFDAVLSVESMHCFTDPDRFLTETARVLRPGGHLLLADEWDRAAPSPGVGAAAAGLQVTGQRDITQDVVRALDLLPSRAQKLRTSDCGSADTYRRFFTERLARDSGRNLRTGRFGYALISAVKQG